MRNARGVGSVVCFGDNLSVPHDQPGVIARLHEVWQVVERNYNGKTARFKARIPPHLHEEFAPFVVRELQAR